MEEEKPWGCCRCSLVRIIWIFWYFGIWFEKNRRIFGCFSVQSHFFECISHFTLRFQMFWDGFILPFLWKKWQQINQCCQIFCHGNAADIKRIVYHSSELSGNTVDCQSIADSSREQIRPQHVVTTFIFLPCSTDIQFHCFCQTVRTQN